MNDTALLRLAGRQHGLVAMRKLARMGYAEYHIRWRIRVGLLFRVYRGVYAVAGAADTFPFRVMAAVLAAGDGAVASHRCAAALFGLRRIRCDRPAITVSDGIDRLLGRVAGSRMPGSAVLEALVAERRAGQKPSETGLEDELLEIFEAYGLPQPVRQYVLVLPGGGQARDESCGLIGWRVRRYATDDIRCRPEGVADDVMRVRAEALAA